MKKNGFTLAELLGVITVLGLLALIIIPTVDKIIKDNNEILYQAQLSTIIEGAKIWSSDHVEELPINGASITITIDDLKSGGYIPIDIKNPKTDELFAGDMTIRITENNSQYNYEVED